MNTITATLLTLAIFSNLSSHAGGNVGNGGDVMLCTKNDGTIKSIELLDYYESRILRKINVDLGSNQLETFEKVQLVLKRIEKFSPRRYATYVSWANSFMEETNFVSEANLVDVPDSEIPFLPDGCRLEQIAIQKAPSFPEDKRYLVNSDIWDLLDNNGKAGLILHEIIYREAIELGQTNSKRVRYFNSVISSLLVEQMTPPQFIKLIASAGFSSVETGNLELTDVKFHPDGKISEADVVSGSLLINGKEIEIAERITYFQNGSVRLVHVKSDIDFMVGVQILSFKAGSIEFHESGNLKTAHLSCVKDAKKIYNGPNYNIKLITECNYPRIARFYSNGVAEYFENVDGIINSSYGQLKIKRKVSFDSGGRIIEAESLNEVKNKYQIGNMLYDFADVQAILNFYPSGAIKGFTSNIQMKSPKNVKIQNFTLPAERQMKFHETGEIYELPVSFQVLRRQDGTLQYFEYSPRVKLDVNGFVMDEEINSSMNLISLNAFSSEFIKSAQTTCASEFAQQLWNQIFPQSCKNSEIVEDVSEYSGFEVQRVCKKDGHHMIFRANDHHNIRSNVDGTMLNMDGPAPIFRSKMFTPEEEFDDLGNPVKKALISEFLVIEIPENYKSSIKVFNSNTNKETKFKLELNTYVECLKTKLNFN